jgi:ABC-2 type transport system ATP-binding protein
MTSVEVKTLSSTPATAISAESLSWWHRSDLILKSIDLHIPEGAVVGLVGRNGAGKSSLLRCLVGLTVPSSGSSSLLGSPSLDLPDSVRERLGYVGQTPDLFDWMDGEAHFKRMAELYANWDSRRALETAMRLDLPLGQRANRLSVGDQQKLSVVLALGHDPDVLLLDEPVASLDPIARRDFMRAVFERRVDLEAKSRTVLISSHLLSDLERVVTHIAFMRDGQIQLFDEWDALVENLRLAELPVGIFDQQVNAISVRGVLRRRAMQNIERVIVDARLIEAPDANSRALNLDELFTELNV